MKSIKSVKVVADITPSLYSVGINGVVKITIRVGGGIAVTTVYGKDDEVLTKIVNCPVIFDY